MCKMRLELLVAAGAAGDVFMLAVTQAGLQAVRSGSTKNWNLGEDKHM